MVPGRDINPFCLGTRLLAYGPDKVFYLRNLQSKRGKFAFSNRQKVANLSRF